MADTTDIKFVYPPNFDGSFANRTGIKRAIIKITAISDATGETNVIKVNRSELRVPAGTVPSKLVVEKIQYMVHGLTVKIAWSYDSEQVIAYLNGGVAADSAAGKLCWEMDGLVPATDTGEGDIVVTTTNASSGDTYDITMTVRLKE